jgi:hypothetical protein
MGKLLECLRSGSGSRLFVHCGTSVDYLAELKVSNPGLEKCAERALLLAEPRDIVCLTDEVEPVYLEFLAHLGIGARTENLIVASRFQNGDGPLWKRLLESEEALGVLSGRMQIEGTTQIYPFLSSAGQFELAKVLREKTGMPIRVVGADPDLVAYADCKHHVRTAAIDLGVPVAPGEVLDLGVHVSPAQRRQALAAAVFRQSYVTGKVIVRGACGAAGSATFVVSPLDCEIDELSAKLELRRANRFYLVEALFPADGSPNIQMHVDPEHGTIECVGVTDQRLTPHLVHTGNTYPSDTRCPDDLIRWAGVLTRWLRDAGYVGLVGFDFVVYTDEHGRSKAFLAELNPRVNGATYPLFLSERLGIAPAFVSGGIRTGVRTFADLQVELHDLLLSPGRQRGVLPYATGCLQYGRCSMIAFGSTVPEAMELLAEAELRLGGKSARGYGLGRELVLYSGE